MQAAHGVSVKSAYLWFRNRAATRHPEPAGTIGRQTDWSEDEGLAWSGSSRDRKLAGRPKVARGGAPDARGAAAEAARIMGSPARAAIPATARPRSFPRPDDYGTTAKGR